MRSTRRLAPNFLMPVMSIFMLFCLFSPTNATEPDLPGIIGQRAMWGARIQAVMIHFMLVTGLSPYLASQECFPENSAKHAVPESTLRRWYDHYLWWGEPPAQTRKLRRYKRSGKKTMRSNHVEFVRQLLQDQPHLHLDEIRGCLKRNFKIKWSTSCIYNCITKTLNLSLQQIQLRAVQASLAERLVYRSVLSTFDDPAMFVFVDETCVGRNESRRRRHWAPRGGPTPYGWEVFMADDEDGAVYSMIAAADINGFIHSACVPVWRKSSKTDGNILRGTVNAQYFEDWVVSSLIPTLGRRDLNEPRSVVILDNASVHSPERVEKLINDAGAVVVWTAPYSPDLNPIERCFHQYKSDLRRQRVYEPDALLRHFAALDSVSRANMIRYYGGQNMEGCIRNLPILSSQGEGKSLRRVQEQVVLGAILQRPKKRAKH